MGATSIFFASLGGIVLLFAFKIWEMSRGSKPFSKLRYRVDLVLHKKMSEIKDLMRFVNVKTARLLLVFALARIQAVVTLLISKITSTRLWKQVKGKFIPEGSGSAVSAFLKDVAEYKDEIIKEEGSKEVEKSEEKL